MNKYDATQATEQSYQLAEGPVWDQDRQRLLWVDIPAGNVHSGTLDGGRIIPTTSDHVDDFTGAVAPTRSGGVLVAGHRAVHELTSSGELRTVADLIAPSQRRRLNDGACDGAGRLVVGSLSLGEAPGQEMLWQVDPSGHVRVLDDDLELSNGIAWSPDGSVLYSVDTVPGNIWARPYDVATGGCGPRQLAFRVTDGSPDGICLDTDGRIWAAVWGAGQVRCYSPQGEQLAVVDVPAPHVSCPAFVGPDLDQLVITTARDDLGPEQLERYPASGRLFLADVDAVGVPTSPWV